MRISFAAIVCCTDAVSQATYHGLTLNGCQHMLCLWRLSSTARTQALAGHMKTVLARNPLHRIYIVRPTSFNRLLWQPGVDWNLAQDLNMTAPRSEIRRSHQLGSPPQIRRHALRLNQGLEESR
jgi:hypothetical protein